MVGKRPTQQTDIVTQWAEAAGRLNKKDGQCHVLAASFTFLNRSSLVAVATLPSNAAPFPPPSSALASTKSYVDCFIVCTPNASRFATRSFSVANQRFMFCSAASSTRLNHSPGFFAAKIQCFELRWASCITIGHARDDPFSPVLCPSE